jgi:uncharacterized protein (TIGR00369 family)
MSLRRQRPHARQGVEDQRTVSRTSNTPHREGGPVTDPFQRVRSDFKGQPFMDLLRAHLSHVGDGEVCIELASTPELTQQHGFVHAGVLSSLMDTACGFAALTVLPATKSVLTAEFKINLLRPARGRLVKVRGEVIKPGRTLVVCQASATLDDEPPMRPAAVMTATIAAVDWTPDLPHRATSQPRQEGT